MKETAKKESPTDWEKVRVGDALKLINGRAFKPSEWSQKGLPIVRIQNLNDPEAPFNYFEGDLPKKFMLNSGDLLFAWSGTPGTSFGAHIWRGDKAWLNQHIFKVIFDEHEFDKRFLRLAINRNLGEYIHAAHGGAGLAHITKGKFEQSELVKPPLNQQQRIVAEIEKQFSRLDEAVANLKRVKANLKGYKAAVLKAAVEGKLTEEWRKQHPDVEPASTLLKCILAERREKWTGGGKYSEPDPPDGNDLPPLPKGWAWASIDQLLREPLRNGHSAKASGNERGLRAFTLSAVTEGDFSERNTKLTVAHPNKVADLWAEPGDIYVERSNTPELVGLARLYMGPAKFAFFPDLLIRVRVRPNVMEKYVELSLLSGRGRRYFRSRSQGISGSMPKIDQSVIQKTPIALPPLAEQREIVAGVERRLSIIEQLQGAGEANFARASHLRQAILAKLFNPLGVSQFKKRGGHREAH